MKLLTTIQPRSNGTVIYTEMLDTGKPGRSFIFERDTDSGELIADVDDDELVGKMLASDNFQPFEEDDFARAEELMAAAQAKAVDRVLKTGRGGKVVSQDADDTFTETLNGGLPVEANTRPVPARRARPARSRAAMGG